MLRGGGGRRRVLQIAGVLSTAIILVGAVASFSRGERRSELAGWTTQEKAPEIQLADVGSSRSMFGYSPLHSLKMNPTQ